MLKKRNCDKIKTVTKKNSRMMKKNGNKKEKIS